jgi:PEGA domain
MKRVLAVVACGLTMSACSSWMPSFDLPSMPSFGGSSAPAATSLAVESDPPGADARASTGATCRTPCRLDVAASGPFTVSVALNGYLPQTVPVQLLRPDDPRLGSQSGASDGPRLDPNPVYVELERAPAAAPPPPKKRSVRRPATAARHAPAPATATQAPTPSAPTTAAAPAAAPPAPAQQPATTAAPWPMPR